MRGLAYRAPRRRRRSLHDVRNELLAVKNRNDCPKRTTRPSARDRQRSSRLFAHTHRVSNSFRADSLRELYSSAPFFSFSYFARGEIIFALAAIYITEANWRDARLLSFLAERARDNLPRFCLPPLGYLCSASLMCVIMSRAHKQSWFFEYIYNIMYSALRRAIVF